MENNTLISVIIPTFNYEKFILEAIESIFNQTFMGKIEILVVDDGSTDNTRKILSPYFHDIMYIYQENKGPSSARNRGIKEAKGEYIAFLDADDLWEKNKLQIQVEFMENHPELGMVFTDMQNFIDTLDNGISTLANKKNYPKLLKQQEKINEIFSMLFEENFIPTISVILRRECFDKVGLFDESLNNVEDLDMWLRISGYFNIAFIPQILTFRRLHKDNLSRNYSLELKSQIKVIKKMEQLFPDKIKQEKINIKHYLSRAYLSLGYQYFVKNEFKTANNEFIKSIILSPNLNSIKYFLASKFLNSSIIDFLRKVKKKLILFNIRSKNKLLSNSEHNIHPKRR